jgi:hypothetical protein
VNRIPAKIKQKPRKILLYKQAKWENVKTDLKNTHATTKRLYDEDASANEIWNHFTSALEDSINRNIPYKTVRKKDGCLWITTDIRRLIKRRD